MNRIACLRIPRFAIAVHEKREPELSEIPWVLLEGKNTNSSVYQQKIAMCSYSATKQEISPGIKLSQACSLRANISWRKPDHFLYEQASAEIIQALLAYSPKINVFGPKDSGIFLLDASGLKLLGGEDKFCASILKAIHRLGYKHKHLGIANSAFPAMVATRVKNQFYHIVAPNKTSAFLARQPVHYLPASKELLEDFATLGIKSMQQLAAFPAESILERFGQEGIKAWKMAQGIDDTLLSLPPLEKTFAATCDLNYPASSLNEVSLVLSGLLTKLANDLKNNALRAERLIVSFYGDDTIFDERDIKLIRPSNHSGFLQQVIKLSLNKRPLEREFTKIKVDVVRFSPESWKQEHVLPYDESDDDSDIISNDLLLLLQKVISRLGENTVVKPIANDQYFPDQSGVWMPVLQKQASSNLLAPDKTYLKQFSKNGAGLVMRKNPNAAPVMVKLDASTNPEIANEIPRPQAVYYHQQWHKIQSLSSPDYLSGKWWEENIGKSYYVAASSTSMFLLVHNHRNNKWFIEYFFD